MPIAALFIGLLIVAQGVVGLVAPDLFVELVRFFQKPPVIYLAAAIRFACGVVLFRVAPLSRAPGALRGLGLLIALGGLITPIFGVAMARVILGWWSEGGSALVRVWAVAALALGALIIYATAPARRTGA